jgi:hemolysin III
MGIHRPMNLQPAPRSPLCQSHGEEMASAATHGLGMLLSIAALVGMILTACNTATEVVCASIFGGSLVLLYGASTLYHAFSGVRLKSILQSLDHACIYLLIAGSYTPVMLISLRGPWGWTLLCVVWAMALAGVVIKLVVPGRKDHWISTALYVVMGWLAVIAIGPLIRALPSAGVAWLVAGGLSYTFGVIFFLWTKLRYHHAIWHLFVLGGSACHVAAVWLYVFR